LPVAIRADPKAAPSNLTAALAALLLQRGPRAAKKNEKARS
jgi:hypothetical protein